jgi:hypothetical protein
VKQGLAINGVTEQHKRLQCNRNYGETLMEFICPHGSSLVHLDIDDMNSTTLESIRYLSINSGDDSRGPLTTIPSNICRFTNLTV